MNLNFLNKGCGCGVQFSQKPLKVGWQGDGLSLAELHPLIVPQYKEIMEQEARRSSEAERTHALFMFYQMVYEKNELSEFFL